VRELLCHPRMRTARATPLCLSDRGTHGLLQLHRRLLQSHPAALRPGVSLTHLLRTGDANRPTVRHPLNRPPKRGNFNFKTSTPTIGLSLIPALATITGQLGRHAGLRCGRKPPLTCACRTVTPAGPTVARPVQEAECPPASPSRQWRPDYAIQEHRPRAGQDLGHEGVEQGGREPAVDDQPAGPRRTRERRVEMERVAVAADPGEGLDVVRADRPDPGRPRARRGRIPVHAPARDRPGQIRSNRSTGRTKTVAPPTSTSSG